MGSFVDTRNNQRDNHNFRCNGEAYKQLFWKAARAYTKAEFDHHMDAMKQKSNGAHAYLNSIPTRHWSRHAFSTRSKSTMLLNNCSESFNNALKKCRDKPILSLMEWMRRYTTKRMLSKKDGIKKFEGILMPFALKQLDISDKESRNCQIVQCGLKTFEVDHCGKRFVVDLEKKSCDCFEWDLSGIPCSHAFGCLRRKRRDPQLFVDASYTIEVYRKAYEPHYSRVTGHKLQ